MGVVPARVAGAKRIVVATPPRAFRESRELRWALARARRRRGPPRRRGARHRRPRLRRRVHEGRRARQPLGRGRQAPRLGARLRSTCRPARRRSWSSRPRGADPARIAADLLAQAEHDPDAVCLLFTDRRELADAAAAEVARQLEGLPTAATARASLAANGFALVFPSLDAAAKEGVAFAAEHVELMGRAAERYAARFAATSGAVFVGSDTPTAFGDYLAGPNHVLPTGGAARSFSGLSVRDFLRWGRSVDGPARRGAEARPRGRDARAVRGARGARPLARPQERAMTRDPLAAVRPEIRALRAYRFDPVPEGLRAKLDFNESPADVPAEAKDAALAALRRPALRPLPGVRRPAAPGRPRGLGRPLARAGRPGERLGRGDPRRRLGLRRVRRHAPPRAPGLLALRADGRRSPARDVATVPLAGDDFRLDEEAFLARAAEGERTVPLLCSPNNPTGGTVSREFVRRLCAVSPVVLLDQAYVDFSEDEDDLAPAPRPSSPNLVVFRTLSKAYSIAGLRVGYAAARPDVAEEIGKAILPFSVDLGAEEIALAALARREEVRRALPRDRPRARAGRRGAARARRRGSPRRGPTSSSSSRRRATARASSATCARAGSSSATRRPSSPARSA